MLFVQLIDDLTALHQSGFLTAEYFFVAPDHLVVVAGQHFLVADAVVGVADDHVGHRSVGDQFAAEAQCYVVGVFVLTELFPFSLTNGPGIGTTMATDDVEDPSGQSVRFKRDVGIFSKNGELTASSGFVG